MNQSALYEKDFYAWCMDQAEALLSNKFELLDFKNLAEEIESMGRRERQELRNRLKILFCHLLKVQYQPERSGKSWKHTIREQRKAIDLLLSDNPSLKYCIEEVSKQAYELAVEDAETQMGKRLPKEATILNYVFTLKEALSPDP